MAKKNKPPAFQFYPQDWLSSKNVKLMSNLERGIYMQLLAHAWLDNGVPIEMENLARLVDEPLESFEKAWKRVGICFFKKDGKYHNERLRQERRKQIEKSRKMARNAAELWRSPSKQKHTPSIKSADAEKCSSSSVSSSISKTTSLPTLSSSKFVKPTAGQVEEYARGIGYRLNGTQFVSFYESKGWMIGRSPMKDWKSAVVTWKLKENQDKAVEAPKELSEARMQRLLAAGRCYVCKDELKIEKQEDGSFRCPCGVDYTDERKNLDRMLGSVGKPI